MEINRIEFIAWMERIMARFDLLSEAIDKSESRRNILDGEELLNNQGLMLIFKTSARSLQRYRSDGRLPYYTISGKIYYKLSDVHQFIREFLFNENPVQKNEKSVKLTEAPKEIRGVQLTKEQGKPYWICKYLRQKSSHCVVLNTSKSN